MAEKEKARSANDFRSFSFDKRDTVKFKQVKKYYENKIGFEIKSYQVITRLLDEKLKDIGVVNGNE